MSEGVEVLNDWLPDESSERWAWFVSEAFWECAWQEHLARGERFVHLLRNPHLYVGRKVRVIVREHRAS